MAKADSILVTGGAGYLGSVLVSVLLSEGHSVRVMDSLCFGGASLLGFWNHPRFEFFHADIRDTQAVRTSLRGIDGVVHLAAIVGDPACSRKPVEAREVNLEATLGLFREVCDAKTAAFLMASTCSNYGMTVPSEILADEETTLAPLSIYAQTKTQSEEHILEMQSLKGPATTVLRFATLFGVSPRMRFDLTVNDFTMQMLIHKHVTVYAGDTWRPYVHVVDASRAVSALLQNKNPGAANVYNIGSTTDNYRKSDIVKLVQEQIPDAGVEYVEKGNDQRNYRVSFAKLYGRLGFAPTRTLSAGISEIVSLLRSGAVEHPDDPKYRN